MKKFLSFLLLFSLILCLSACSDHVIGGDASDGAVPEAREDAVIQLNGDSASYPGGGVSIKDRVVTIGAPGSYTVRGTLNDGRIIVDLKENPGKVSLILDGADISCLTDSAIYLVQAKELNLVLAPGSDNRIVSGTEAQLSSYSDSNQGAAIFAEDDLDIQGEGSLTVCGYINNAVTCKDDLKIKSGTLSVVAANNGLRASESVTVSGGTITVEAGNDGVKASSAKKAGKGFVRIEGGELNVTAGGDGVSAESELSVTDGTLHIRTTGDPSAASCKGLKGKTGLTVSGGTISVEAQDHALRSGAGLTVSGGTVEARSAQGKGLAAEGALLVEDGFLSVVSADDGLASATEVTVSGGTLEIRAGADGIQGGKKGTGFGDAVGSVSFEGGVTLISASNKPVDGKASFAIRGGTLFACGNGKFTPASEIPFLLATVGGSGGDALSVSDRAEPLVLRAAYSYSTVLYASSELAEGQSYSLSFGSDSLEIKAGLS